MAPPTFKELLASARSTAVHLEMRDAYMPDPAFDAWLGGSREDHLTEDEDFQTWLEWVRETTARGVAVRRARVFSVPESDYIRWEHFISHANVAAGEDIRWLSRRDTTGIAFPGNDFWIFDDAQVLVQHFMRRRNDPRAVAGADHGPGCPGAVPQRVRGGVGAGRPARRLQADLARSAVATSPFPAVEEARRSLGVRLRDLRRAGGFKTARAFAARVGWSESKVSRIEHGITSPSEDDLRAYTEHSGAQQDYEDLVATASSIQEMYVEWKRVFANGLTPVQEAALPRYERTRHFRIYEPGVIPGLLQTPAYAQALMGRIIDFWGIPDDAEQAAEVRAVRKAGVLRDSRPPVRRRRGRDRAAGPLR